MSLPCSVRGRISLAARFPFDTPLRARVSILIEFGDGYVWVSLTPFALSNSYLGFYQGMDVNNDGRVSRKEFREVVTLLGVGEPPHAGKVVLGKPVE